MKRTREARKRGSGRGWSLDAATYPPEAGQTRDASRPGPPLVRLRLEKRRGKPVTVAEAEGLDRESLRALTKELKTRCGSGGTAKGSSVELQGEHRDTLRVFLPEKGIRVKG